jgi:hypothetical protein
MKRFVGFILLGVAAVEFLTSLIYVFVYPQTFEFSGMPASFTRIVIISTIATTSAVCVILVCIAIYILIKGTR